MEEFPSNSHSSTEKPSPVPGPKKHAETKKIEQVTKTTAVRRKKPLGTRFKQLFIGGDAKSVWGFVTGNVLIPAAKDMIADATTQAVEQMVFGESRSRGRGNYRAGFTPYNRYANSANTPPWRQDRQDPREVSRRARATHDFDEILLDSRGEAEEVIDQMMEILSQYQSVSVADLYALVGISAAYTDGKYGWTDLRGANVSHVRGGAYLLNLPKPHPLD